jgi:hypothetical protein
MDIQAVFWDGNWSVESGCVERIFTLVPNEDIVVARYRAQVQGFVGGIDELYLGLLDINRAIESDIDDMMGRVAKSGRVTFSLPLVYEGEVSQFVITVERDPRDLMPEAGGWGSGVECGSVTSEDFKKLTENAASACVPADAVSSQEHPGAAYGRISCKEPNEVNLTPGRSIDEIAEQDAANKAALKA